MENLFSGTHQRKPTEKREGGLGFEIGSTFHIEEPLPYLRSGHMNRPGSRVLHIHRYTSILIKSVEPTRVLPPPIAHNHRENNEIMALDLGPPLSATGRRIGLTFLWAYSLFLHHTTSLALGIDWPWPLFAGRGTTPYPSPTCIPHRSHAFCSPLIRENLASYAFLAVSIVTRPIPSSTSSCPGTSAHRARADGSSSPRRAAVTGFSTLGLARSYGFPPTSSTCSATRGSCG